ncbi:MAG: DUF4149 domain-containing protein [Planctomycetota bacterium]
MQRLIHGLTDLFLGTLIGLSAGAAVSALTIFGVSAEQGFDKHIANTLAGNLFDKLGWPMLALSGLCMAGCIYGAKCPPMLARAKAWKIMGGFGVLIFVAGLATQLYFAPLMHDLRENSTWVNGELKDPAEKKAFGQAHGMSMTVSLIGTLLAAGVLVGRRVFTIDGQKPM